MRPEQRVAERAEKAKRRVLRRSLGSRGAEGRGRPRPSLSPSARAGRPVGATCAGDRSPRHRGGARGGRQRQRRAIEGGAAVQERAQAHPRARARDRAGRGGAGPGRGRARRPLRLVNAAEHRAVDRPPRRRQARRRGGVRALGGRGVLTRRSWLSVHATREQVGPAASAHRWCDECRASRGGSIRQPLEHPTPVDFGESVCRVDRRSRSARLTTTTGRQMRWPRSVAVREQHPPPTARGVSSRRTFVTLDVYWSEPDEDMIGDRGLRLRDAGRYRGGDEQQVDVSCSDAAYEIFAAYWPDAVAYDAGDELNPAAGKENPLIIRALNAVSQARVLQTLDGSD